MYTEYRIAVDVGGTFTDLIAMDSRTGKITAIIKVPSTPKNPEKGVIKAVEQFLQHYRSPKIKAVIHATTIATNSLLGQVGLELPKVALITTKGFRDIIEIGRQRRPRLYDFFASKPRVLVERKYRFEVSERLNANGDVVEPLSEKDVQKIIEKLREEEIKSIAVSFLHSYLNPVHELRVKELLLSTLRGVYISLSCEVAPEHREYERTCTTVVNALLLPIIEKYFLQLEEGLQKLDVKAPLLIMQSNGGVASANIAAKLPVSVIESGPAAGVIAAAYYGRMMGINNVLSFDMGGTTAKAGAVINGSPLITTEYEVGGEVHAGRIIKGSGYPVRYPFIDLAEVSAGGGSIVWVDKGGIIRVGPISAGADPGPACYGKGGENPTITDANLILGRLNQKYLLGGKMKVFRELSEKAFRDKISAKIGVEVEEAALGAIEIANTVMSKVLRIVTVERGLDPRDFVLVAFGGAGPMHACALAEDLEISKIIVPAYPGMFSAVGLLVTDFKHTFVRSIRKIVDEIDPVELETIFGELEAKGREILRSEGVLDDQIVIRRTADMRYESQGYELSITVNNPVDENEIKELKKRFHEVHHLTYGYKVEEEAVEIVNVRMECVGLTEKPKLKVQECKLEENIEEAMIEKRTIYFENEEQWLETPVYLKDKLREGSVVFGPAIIEQYDSTIVVYPEWVAKVDSYSNVLLSRGE